MMQHYLELKEQNPDAILMYRLGDFYEMFFEDARTVSRELDLVLTARAAGAEKAPMCGVPHHSVNAYISRLVRKGYRVAICEQLEDPSQAVGLVERGIIRIITPGTWMDEDLSDRNSNYMAVLHSSGWKACLIYCDFSTGNLKYEYSDPSITSVMKKIRDMHVSEVVSDRSFDKSWTRAMSEQDDFSFSFQKAQPLEIQDENLLTVRDDLLKATLEILMGYLQKTQMKHADHLQPLRPLHQPTEMILDADTRAHLELVHSASGSSKAQSLWEFMDRCRSSMGSRMLKNWIESPLTEIHEIRKRQQGIQTLLDQFLLREQLRDHLDYIYDLERLAARVSFGSASPRDVLQLTASLEHARPILELSKQIESYPELQKVPDGQDLYVKIRNAIREEPPLTLKDGNVFSEGYSPELDEIRKLADASSQAILEMEAAEREKTGIKNLKIGYNRVFGYYIEIRNGSISQVKPEWGYAPRQTLANSTRYTTQALKELEEKILNAQDQKVRLEMQLFQDLLQEIKACLPQLHELAKALALVDVLYSLAVLANDCGYICPIFNDDHHVDVEEGRHPILEQKLSGFVSNDWKMGSENHIQIITGPNMGGKSTYLRQNALLAVMAQMGSFIPARKASLPVFDRIFTRIGASDDLLTGKSTFMVEMLEANTALQFATENSLILFDEIGRGTSTYDGMALARAMLEYFDDVVQAKTLFSTHYHELTDLDEGHPGIENVHADVSEKNREVTFRYRIISGKADKSYGIHVARLASLPESVIHRAEDLLADYENQNQDESLQPSFFVMEKTNPARSALLNRMEQVDVDALSARDALDFLYELKELSKKAQEN